MFKKGTKIYSVLKGKCPRCNEGDFFKYKITFNPSKITKLHDNCAKCNLRYMLEPSFFYGAMYVNYGITVGLSVITFLIASLVFNLKLLQAFVAIFITLIILAPVNLRLARIVWIHMFVSYRKK
jgi:uncharacterized protein (DUF983 family)